MSVLDRLEALVGPAEIRYPDNIEIRRDRLRDLIAVARAADDFRHFSFPDPGHYEAWKALMQTLAPLLTRDSDA